MVCSRCRCSAGDERKAVAWPNPTSPGGIEIKPPGHLVWIFLLSGFVLGCHADLHPVPRDADPAEREAVATLKPLAEHLSWDEDGNVREIDICGQRITPEVLTALLNLKELVELNLAGTDIRDDQLAQLKELPQLRALGLQWTSVGDAGIVHLVEIESLTSLDLSHTRITDKGLNLLCRKRNLTNIFLAGTAVTQEGVTALRRALPACRIQTE